MIQPLVTIIIIKSSLNVFLYICLSNFNGFVQNLAYFFFLANGVKHAIHDSNLNCQKLLLNDQRTINMELVNVWTRANTT